MRLSLNQRGASQIILPLFLIAGIALAVYLAQQQTELTPSAQDATAPTGCKKITPASRSVCYKTDAGSAPVDCKESMQEGKGDHPDHKVKEVTWTFSGGWKNVSGKGELTGDGDRLDLGSMPPRFDSPSGKSFEQIDNDPISSNGTNRDGEKIAYRVRGGQAVVVEFAFTKVGTNFQGVTTNPDGTPAKTYDKDKSYAFVPENEGSDVRCDGVGTTSTGSKSNGDSCDNGKQTECKSGRCSNSKCVQGTKAGNASCTNREECQSNTCTNGKCEGGSIATGRACDDDDQCASNKCGTDGKCVSAIASASPRSSASPRASSAGGGGGGATASTAPGASTTPGASTAPAASTPAASTPAGSTPPAASTPPGTTPVRLTKAEITGFKTNFDALYARLGTTKDTGNMKIVSTIANNELTAIVSQLSTCPDDANVGTCVDTKFRTRFDLAKTAARLTAFYGTFNGIKGICVKSDLGLNPLITGTSQTNVTGRVNPCTDRLVGTRIWMIFTGGTFTPILSTDTRFPQNPSCQTLPSTAPTDVAGHYRNAETLFNSQPGFLQNTLCDGKTLVVPGGTT